VEKLGNIERTADGRYELRFTRRINATREEVWAALTERDRLEGWLGRVRYEPRVGATLTIDFGEGEAIHGEVLQFEPLRCFAISWVEAGESAVSVVRFELFAERGGTRLELTHAKQPVGMARTTAAGWHAHLDLLNGYLEGTPLAWDSVYSRAKPEYEDAVRAL
jgi:uncharacterized protein YndB with AHSA1/START domain